MTYRAPTEISHHWYDIRCTRKTWPSHSMNWMCTRLQALWRTACHKLCVTCHVSVTCHRLLEYSEVCTTGTATTTIFFLQVQLVPKPLQEQSPREVFRSGECWALQPPRATAPAVKPWQGTSHRLPEPSAAQAPSARGPNIKNCRHGEVQKAGSSEALEMTLPSFGQLMLKHECEEQRRSRSCTAAVPPARWLIPGRRHNQTHEPGSQKMGLH